MPVLNVVFALSWHNASSHHCFKNTEQISNECMKLMSRCAQFIGNSTLPGGGRAEYRGNTIYNIYLLPPDKEEALAYLDDGGSPPGRFAQAVVIRGALAVPDVMTYKVSRLLHSQLS